MADFLREKYSEHGKKQTPILKLLRSLCPQEFSRAFIVYFGVSVLILVIIVTQLFLSQNTEIESAKESVANSLHSTSASIAASLDTIKVALWRTSEYLAENPSQMHNFSIKSLKEMPIGTLNISTLEYSLFGANGDTIQSTTGITNVNIRDRESFKALMGNPEMEFYVANPVLGKLRNAWVIIIAKKIRAKKFVTLWPRVWRHRIFNVCLCGHS